MIGQIAIFALPNLGRQPDIINNAFEPVGDLPWLENRDPSWSGCFQTKLLSQKNYYCLY